ncbi:Hsp20/alpha crystallin family protein [Williamsia sp.]|uniref:Hsp20/alpha crystallin family protein n=1 Tax=Williamsia sp. TaxID=1872085 RepID=UPI002F93243B
MDRVESISSWRPFDNHLIRIEDHIGDDAYTLRAEMPGVDPDKAFDISVRDGQLMIKAERSEARDEDSRSEFRYGSFYRLVPLPAGVKDESIEASYTDGILQVRMPFDRSPSDTRHIPVHAGDNVEKVVSSSKDAAPEVATVETKSGEAVVGADR